jgi:hypothetical protein
MDYDEYVKTLESVGDSILEWADPNHTFRGHTEVRFVTLSLRKDEWLLAFLGAAAAVFQSSCLRF